MIIIHDIEVFGNYFLAMFYEVESKTFKHFVIWDTLNERSDLISYMNEHRNSYFVGYNNLGYDMPIIEFVLQNEVTSRDIKAFSNAIIEAQRRIYPKMGFNIIDLMQVNNFGPMSAKSTNLKKLEFNLRKKKILDLPYHHTEDITTYKQSDEIIKYCKWDCEVTADVLEFSKDLIKMRSQLGKLENLDLLNSPEPEIARKYCIKYLSKSMGMSEWDFKQLKTYNDYIKGSEIILPHIKIKYIPEYVRIFEFYKNLYLEPTSKSSINGNKIISLKNRVSEEFTYKNCKYTYAAGGLHACIEPGVYEQTDDWIIEDYDKTSFYPHFSMLHGISANHIPTQVYADLQKQLFDKRQMYPKKTHFVLNHGFKIILNSLYGLSNSEYFPFYDTKATLAICVNGMLTLTMLLDRLYNEIPELVLYQANTRSLVL